MSSLRICCHNLLVAHRQSMLPKIKRPSRARDKATHTRFSVFRKPILLSGLLLTKERIMILFSSPWKLSTTVTERSLEISKRCCSCKINQIIRICTFLHIWCFYLIMYIYISMTHHQVNKIINE